MEATVPCKEVDANDDFITVSMLSTDPVENIPIINDVGITTLSASLVLITEFPMNMKISDSRCLEMQSPNGDIFSISDKFLVLLWIIVAKYTGNSGCRLTE